MTVNDPVTGEGIELNLLSLSEDKRAEYLNDITMAGKVITIKTNGCLARAVLVEKNTCIRTVTVTDDDKVYLHDIQALNAKIDALSHNIMVTALKATPQPDLSGYRKTDDLTVSGKTYFTPTLYYGHQYIIEYHQNMHIKGSLVVKDGEVRVECDFDLFFQNDTKQIKYTIEGETPIEMTFCYNMERNKFEPYVNTLGYMIESITIDEAYVEINDVLATKIECDKTYRKTNDIKYGNFIGDVSYSINENIAGKH